MWFPRSMNSVGQPAQAFVPMESTGMLPSSGMLPMKSGPGRELQLPQMSQTVAPQPVPVVSGGLASSSGSGSMQPSGGDPEDESSLVTTKQRWLLFLRHCAKCRLPEQECLLRKQCSFGKQLWHHILQCQHPMCEFSSCIDLKALLKHHQKCQEQWCPICGPVREHVRRKHAEQQSVSMGAMWLEQEPTRMQDFSGLFPFSGCVGGNWGGSMMPKPGSNMVPNPGSTMVPYPGSGMVPNPDSTMVPNPGSGLVPNSDSSIVSNPGSNMVPNPGNSMVPNPSSNMVPNPSSSMVPNPSSCMVPNPGSSMVPNPGSNMVPNPGSNMVPNPSSCMVPNSGGMASSHPGMIPNPGGMMQYNMPLQHQQYNMMQRQQYNIPMQYPQQMLPGQTQPMQHMAACQKRPQAFCGAFSAGATAPAGFPCGLLSGALGVDEFNPKKMCSGDELKRVGSY